MKKFAVTLTKSSSLASSRVMSLLGGRAGPDYTKWFLGNHQGKNQKVRSYKTILHILGEGGVAKKSWALKI